MPSTQDFVPLPAAGKKWLATFDDEFDTLSASATGAGTTWTTGSGSLPNNGEIEEFIGATGPDSPFSTTNGVLDITAAPGTNPAGQPYNSGLIHTYGSFTQTYGYFAIRAMLPDGAGMWPAFWLLSGSGRTTPELDVFEAMGSDPGHVHMSTHSGTGGTTVIDTTTAAVDAAAGFHVYGVDWERDATTFFIDGQAVAAMPTPADMDAPMFMIVDLAVGGAGSVVGAATGETGHMLVDWVRAYQQAPAAAAAATPAAAPATGSVPGLFDAGYYLAHNPDVAASGMDPYRHFLDYGWNEGRNPDGWFDVRYYLAQNPDVKAAGIDPLAHFMTYGWKEGRQPSLLFDDAHYLAANPDVQAAGMDPLAHYEAYGRNEGRQAFLTGGTAAADPLVNAAFYDAQLGATLVPAGTAGAQQAAWSYDASGWQKGLDPDALFDTSYYLARYPDVAAAHINPLTHYETYGWREGRDPSPQFSTGKYLGAYADVKAAGVDPLLHYIVFGQSEGRQIFLVA